MLLKCQGNKGNFVSECLLLQAMDVGNMWIISPRDIMLFYFGLLISLNFFLSCIQKRGKLGVERCVSR